MCVCVCLRACVCVRVSACVRACVRACLDAVCVTATCVCGEGEEGGCAKPQRWNPEKNQKKTRPDISLHGTGSIWLCGIKPAGEDIGADNRQHT